MGFADKELVPHMDEMVHFSTNHKYDEDYNSIVSSAG